MERPADLLTSAEVAERLRVSVATVLRWGREGVLPVVKIERTVRFRAADVATLLEREATA